MGDTSDAKGRDERRDLAGKRLLDRCEDILLHFVVTTVDTPVRTTDGVKYRNNRVPIVVRVLNQMLKMPDDKFRNVLPRFYSLFGDLMITEVKEIRVALRDIFIRIG